MTDLDYPMVVWATAKEEGGGFVAFAPDLEGCMSDGESTEEALANLKTAILEWIDEAVALGRSIPAPGSRSAQMMEERKEIRKLLKAQEKLIKTQDDVIKEYKNQLVRVQEISTHLEQYQRFDRFYCGILGDSSEVKALTRRGKKVSELSH